MKAKPQSAHIEYVGNRRKFDDALNDLLDAVAAVRGGQPALRFTDLMIRPAKNNRRKDVYRWNVRADGAVPLPLVLALDCKREQGDIKVFAVQLPEALRERLQAAADGDERDLDAWVARTLTKVLDEQKAQRAQSRSPRWRHDGS